MSTDPARPERYLIRLFQTHNASGAAAPAEFTETIRPGLLYTVASDTMIFLGPLTPLQTATPGSFTYTDPARGSGWLRLENFGSGNTARIQEYVQMAQIERAIGRQPLRAQDIAFGNSQVLRSNNPYFFFGFGTVLLGLVVYMLTNAHSSIPLGVIIGFVALFLALSAALFVYGAIKVTWWHKARRYARKNFGTLPSDLKGL